MSSGPFKAQLREWGVLPKGWYVGTQWDGNLYWVSPSGSIEYFHPCDRNEDFSDIERDPDKPNYATEVPGIVHPATYIEFDPRDWKLNRAVEDTKLPASEGYTKPQIEIGGYAAVRNLYTAMSSQQGIIDDASETARKKFLDICLEEREREMKNGPDKLYHLSDREATVPFKWESMLSRVTRRYSRDLILLTPEIEKDLSNWEHCWEMHSDMRPSVRFRYSVGSQEVYPPILLGAVPMPGESHSLKAYWFWIKPVSKRAKQLVASWRGEMAWSQDVAKRFGISDLTPKILQIAAVDALRHHVLHRIGENQLGRWIHQFANYYKETEPMLLAEGRRKYFKFDPQGVYDGLGVSYLELSAWILTSAQGSTARKASKCWDDALEGLSKSQQDGDSEAYAKMRQSFMVLAGL